jgi:FkbM family methyltransferase
MDTMLSPLLDGARSLDDLLRFDRYIAVGANSGGDQVRRWLAAHGKEVMAFTDLSPALRETVRDGLPVLAPDRCRARMDARTAFVIGTVRQKEAAELLVETLGVDPGQVFPFVNPMFAAHYRAGIQAALAPRLAAVRSLLADAQSRAYFDRVCAFYRTLEPRHLAAQPLRVGQYGYRAPGANPRPGARIVDCGAFTGDTFPDFLEATGGDCHIHALEAFAPNFVRLTDFVARNGLGGKVRPRRVAVAGAPGLITICGDDSIADGCARLGGGGAADTVEAQTLDNLFAGERIDYLKMDIEGADLDALEGGRRLLRACRPVVAVAAYHKPEHVVEIAEFLQQTLAPCRLYAAHDPNWVFHIHYIAVPDERAAHA